MPPSTLEAISGRRAGQSALPRFAVYAWAVLAYNMAVVAWGAFVRATGSGAGCGQHWPMCNGEVIPRSPRLETVIEFSHRVTAGISTLSVFGLIAGAFLLCPRRHPARRAAVWAGVFTILEALIGAGLVLFQKVAKDQSAGRVVYLSVHLINTFLLVAAIALTAWWASGLPRLRWREGWAAPTLTALAVTLLLGVSGAITALGDTLYPSASFSEGLRADFAATGNFLVGFRKFHPLLAMAAGSYLAAFAWSALRRVGSRNVAFTAKSLIGLIAAQWVLGTLDALLLAPIWLQLAHLVLADLLWIAAVLLAVSVNSSD